MYVCRESTKLIDGQPMKGVVRMRERERESGRRRDKIITSIPCLIP